jgi:hypothetical protein
MPKYDSGPKTHRFYVRTPLPKDEIKLPSKEGFKGKYYAPPPRNRLPHHYKGFTNERPSLGLSHNPGYHKDIQALGGHPDMNLF